MTHTKAKNIITAYNAFKKSNMHTIYDAYRSPSARKVSAYYDCLRECIEKDGYFFRIIGAGVQAFSCGYCCYVGDREAFVWITKGNTRFVYLDEIDG